jgi:DNA integrity scanning protein DisA with diadenylate cyclase activity
MKLAWSNLSEEIDINIVNLGNEAKQIRTQLLMLLSSKNPPSNNFGIPINA